MADGREPIPDIVLMMAALIAAVKTAKLEDREYQGMKTPRFQYAMSQSVVIAECLYERMRGDYQ